MKETFDKYVNNYDLENEKIRFRYKHCLRVMELSKKYSKLLGFNDYDVELATLIGLIHDIGRFEQIKIYDSFDDSKTVDHAHFGVKILFEEGMIKSFWKNEEDYELIRFAIENHNKFKIPNIEDERIMKHAKLIRDMDKLDIVYLLGYLKDFNTKATNDDISEEFVNSIKNHHSLLYKYRKNHNDDIVIKFGYVFDIYNDICLKEMKDNLKHFYEQIGNKEKFEEIYLEVMKYIDERIC